MYRDDKQHQNINHSNYRDDVIYFSVQHEGCLLYEYTPAALKKQNLQIFFEASFFYYQYLKEL